MTDPGPILQPEHAPPDVLQFSHNNGGLNNQKLALLGLFLEAGKQGRPLRLPAFFNCDHVRKSQGNVAFGQVFSRSAIDGFAQRHGIDIEGEVGADAPDETASWPYFGAGATHIADTTARRAMTPDDFACDFLRSLRPLIAESHDYDRLRGFVFDEKRTELVIQMRIESDWRFYSAVTLQPTIGEEEDYRPSFRQIMEKVRNTLPDRAATAYVVCDEAALTDSLADIRLSASSEFGIDLIWKSDVLGEAFVSERSVLDLSLIDFEMSLQPDFFVGLTRSTFSNIVSFQRYAATRADVGGHFIYNAPGPFLKARTDNGAFASPEGATEVR